MGRNQIGLDHVRKPTYIISNVLHGPFPNSSHAGPVAVLAFREVLCAEPIPPVLLACLLILFASLTPLAQENPGSRGVAFGPDIRLSGSDPQGFSQNETAIAVNPRDPNNLVVVFQGRFLSTEVWVSCFFATSVDGGRTWTLGGRAPLERSDEFCADPSVTADADGNFYFSYLDGDLDPSHILLELDALVAEFPFAKSSSGTPITGPVTIQIVKSSNGGVTWSLPAPVASDLPSPGFFLLRNADPDFGVQPGRGLGANSMPAAAISPEGSLHVAWVDFPAGSCIAMSVGDLRPACTNADVRLSVSRNGGASWTPPVKVSDETNATDQFLPGIAAHPDGRLSLIWMDKRLDPNNVNYDAFYTRTADASSFLPNVRISMQTSVTGTLTFLEDYNGLAATQDSVIPVWGDARFGNPDVFLARGQLLP